MLKYAIVFAAISLLAGALVFGGLAAGIAKLLFALCLMLAALFLGLALMGVGAAKRTLH